MSTVVTIRYICYGLHRNHVFFLATFVPHPLESKYTVIQFLRLV